MHFNVLNRKVHHWASFVIALPIVIIIGSGVLLQTKKHWGWVQPPEVRGAGTVPAIGFSEIMTTLRSDPALGVSGWDDVSRIDVRADRGLAKVTLTSGWEAQVDLSNGRLLQTAYRRSDLIESIHDGSFFGGNATKLGLFFPAGVGLLLLWMTGLWMIWVPLIAKRRRRLQRQRYLAAIAVLASGLGTAALGQPRLAIDPIIGHWESTVENGETVIVADARKWKTEKAATPFPLAAVEGISRFTDGALTVKFKLVAGESDQVAGLVFGLTPRNEYMYVRYNTKDGNIALWQFVDGDRKRILDGTEHLQLPLGDWHELRLEVRGLSVRASVDGKLSLNHQLPAAVPGRVGFWTKRDSTTAFKDFVFTR